MLLNCSFTGENLRRKLLIGTAIIVKGVHIPYTAYCTLTARAGASRHLFVKMPTIHFWPRMYFQVAYL